MSSKILQQAHSTMLTEAEAIGAMAARLDVAFEAAIQTILSMQG